MAAQDDDEDPGTEDVPNLALLKWIVIGMGAVIVVGVLFLIYTVATRAGRGEMVEQAPAAAAPAAPGFGSAGIAVPAGAQIVGTGAGGGLVVLTVRVPGAPDMAVLVDAATGRERGRLVLEPGAEPAAQ